MRHLRDDLQTSNYPLNYFEPREPEIQTYRIEFSNGFDLDVDAYDEVDARDVAIYELKYSESKYINPDIHNIISVINLTEQENFG